MEKMDLLKLEQTKKLKKLVKGKTLMENRHTSFFVGLLFSENSAKWELLWSTCSVDWSQILT